MALPCFPVAAVLPLVAAVLPLFATVLPWLLPCSCHTALWLSSGIFGCLAASALWRSYCLVGVIRSRWYHAALWLLCCHWSPTTSVVVTLLYCCRSVLWLSCCVFLFCFSCGCLAAASLLSCCLAAVMLPLLLSGRHCCSQAASLSCDSTATMGPCCHQATF